MSLVLYDEPEYLCSDLLHKYGSSEMQVCFPSGRMEDILDRMDTIMSGNGNNTVPLSISVLEAMLLGRTEVRSRLVRAVVIEGFRSMKGIPVVYGTSP